MDKLDKNVQRLNTFAKRIKIYDWLCDIKADIVFLQETHFIQKNEYKYNARWFGESCLCFSYSSFSSGVLILFRKKIQVEILYKHTSIDGRKQLIIMKIDHDIITLVNMHQIMKIV